ncbi:MAG: hypothetical protein KDD44_05625, partial [Bdellovibrionales bacterium]|nr:hypothetical protein [Bdellovibrionales bacterium]
LIERVTPEKIFERNQLSAICTKAIAQLDNLEQEVLLRYFVHDQSIVQIAKELDYCRCHLSRVKNRALKKLERLLAPATGIEPSELPRTSNVPKKKSRKKRNYTGGRGRRKGTENFGLSSQPLAVNQ